MLQWCNLVNSQSFKLLLRDIRLNLRISVNIRLNLRISASEGYTNSYLDILTVI